MEGLVNYVLDQGYETDTGPLKLTEVEDMIPAREKTVLREQP